MLDIISVVLGGGAGTRLFPLTAHRSKPAVPLAGKYRLIDIPVSNSLNSDINRIMVLTQYNSASLNRHISSAYRFDRFGRGFVTILAAEQTASSKDWFQGTADAVRQSFQHLKAHRHSHVLILSGDQLYQMDYRQMFNRHKDAKAEITIATIPVTAEDATGFGILKTDKDGLIQEFHEKPSADELEGLESEVSAEMKAAGRVYLASMGIYIFNRGCLGSSLDEHPEHTDFGKQVIPNAIAHRRVVSYPFEGYWSDIGTIRSFYDANLMLAQRNPPFDMYNPIRPVYTNARVLPPAKVQSSYVQDSLIAEACLVVSSHISNSVIGIRSFVGSNTTIKNSIIMGADHFRWHSTEDRVREVDGPEKPGIGAESYIENAIIDRNVSIGERCVIKNQHGVTEGEGDNFYIRDGIVIIPKNASIPNDTII